MTNRRQIYVAHRVLRDRCGDSTGTEQRILVRFDWTAPDPCGGIQQKKGRAKAKAKRCEKTTKGLVVGERRVESRVHATLIIPGFTGRNGCNRLCIITEAKRFRGQCATAMDENYGSHNVTNQVPTYWPVTEVHHVMIRVDPAFVEGFLPWASVGMLGSGIPKITGKLVKAVILRRPVLKSDVQVTLDHTLAGAAGKSRISCIHCTRQIFTNGQSKCAMWSNHTPPGGTRSSR